MKNTTELLNDLMRQRDYYRDQLGKVRPHTTEYAPTIKIFANGNGEDTKHLDLNTESAKALVEWLKFHFIP